MIRENKDGRPIFYDSIWNKIINIGKKLIKLGYKETEKKPNLFYKPIKTEKNSKDDKTVQVKGVVFADLRGTGFVPIWDDPSPLFYSLDLPISVFLPEFILLVQSGCSPRVSFEEECESGGWMFGLDELPSGYCKRCGENILSEVNWEILKEDFFELYHQGIEHNDEYVQLTETVMIPIKNKIFFMWAENHNYVLEMANAIFKIEKE